MFPLVLSLLLQADPAVTAAEDDRRAILAHVDGLFRAYFRRDLEAIRRGHTADWTGFQIGSREIVFRHPDLGERRTTAMVTLKEPVRISMDLRKK